MALLVGLIALAAFKSEDAASASQRQIHPLPPSAEGLAMPEQPIAGGLRAFPESPTQAPRLILPLFGPAVGVQNVSEAPRVRVYSAEDELLADVTAQAPPGVDGTWAIDLSPDADLLYKLILKPGMQIEMTAGDTRVSNLTVPDLQATVDAETDRVEGDVPGFAAAALVFYSDPDWFGPLESPAPIVLATPGGRLAANVGETFDIRPGTWGDVAVQNAGGHVFTLPFAPPAATVVWSAPYSLVRSDPRSRPVISLSNPGGRPYFVSLPGYQLSGSLFAVTLFDPDDPEAGAFQFEVGDELSLEVWPESPASVPAFRVTLPEFTASIDRSSSKLVGRSPPEARISARVTFGAMGGESSFVTTASEAGFEIDLSGQALLRDSTATVWAYAGGPVGHATRAVVARIAFDLFGDSLEGAVLGRGTLDVSLSSPSGERIAVGRVDTDMLGRFSIDLVTDAGERAQLAPGHFVDLVPDQGPRERLDIPELSAKIDGASRSVEGAAPPGSRIEVDVFTDQLNPYGGNPFATPAAAFDTDSDGDGAWRVTCGPGCEPSYAQVWLDAPRATVRLVALRDHLIVVDVTEAAVTVQATSGTRATVGTESADGPIIRAGHTIPTGIYGLPLAIIGFGDVHPDGLPDGLDVGIAVGTAHIDLTIPTFTWQADTLSDLITGQGPPLRPMAVLAQPGPGDASRQPGQAVAVIAADGSYTARFTDYDLRAGDILTLYVGLPDRAYLQYTDYSVDGAAEPSPTAVDPVASPTPSGTLHRAYLPGALQAAGW